MSNGRVPDEIHDSVLKSLDIAEVVGRYVSLTKQGHYLKGLCPFHSEKSPSFTVTPEKQIYHCFGCGVGGNAIRFVSEVEGLSYGQALRKLADEANLEIGWGPPPTPAETQESRDRAKLLEAYELAAKLYQYILHNTEQGKPGKAYLQARGISDKLMETFGIGYIPNSWDTLTKLLDRKGFPLPLMEQGGLLSPKSDGSGYVDKFRDRIIFPIHDWKGQIIAFGGRAMGDAKPKYMNSPESMLFHKSRTLYNLHAARPQIRKAQQMVLFEGYMDTIRAWDAGVHNGVATMGTALTPEHAESIRRLADRVILAYDGDSAGKEAAYKSIPLLEKAGCLVSVALLPGGLDPDEFIKEHGSERFVREVIETAVPSIKYKLLYYRKNFRLQEDGERLRYIKQMLSVIAGLASPIEREHYVKDLTSEFNYSYDTAMQTVNEARLQAEEKNNKSGDNKDKPWNNGMNDGRVRESAKPQAKPLSPAYQNAERNLLAVMMVDREIAAHVESKLGDEFNVEAHAALAAYLYAYYAGGFEPNASTFIGMLQDDKLESLASSLTLIDNRGGINDAVIDDYIREIRRYPLLQELEQKKKEVKQAERSGDIPKALQLGSEIISLEKQLKSS